MGLSDSRGNSTGEMFMSGCCCNSASGLDNNYSISTCMSLLARNVLEQSCTSLPGKVMAVSRPSARRGGLRKSTAFSDEWSCYPANVCTQMIAVGSSLLANHTIFSFFFIYLFIF